MKLKNTLIVMVILVLMAPLSEGPRAKADYKDKDYSFALLHTDPNYKLSSFASKANDSSVYVRGTEFTGTLSKVNLQVYGSKYSNGLNKENRTVSKGRIYYYTQNAKAYKLYNNVNESNDLYAAIATKAATGDGTAIGKWSPDCAGESSIPLMNYK